MANELLKIGARNTKGLAKPFLVEGDGMAAIPDTYAMLQRVTTPAVLDIPAYDGSGQVVHPAVVKVYKPWNGYKYWMAFTPYPYSDSTKENPSIVASTDGISWVVPDGLTNPVFPHPGVDGSYNRDVQLIFAQDENNNRGRLYLYWGRQGVTPVVQRSYSDDGVTWSEPENCTLDVWGVVRKGANNWECFVKSGTNFLCRWVSEDGLNWIRANPHVPTNLQGNIWHLSTYYDAAGYHFLACAYPMGGHIHQQNLYYGFSKDGSEVVFDAAPLVTPKDGTFYAETAYHASLIPIGDNYFRVYMSATGDGNVWKIGYFDAKVSAPAAKIGLVKSPRSESVEKFVFHKAELRDTSNHYVWVPELSEFEHKILAIENNLKDAEGQAVTVNVFATNNMRNNFSEPNTGDIVKVGGKDELFKLEVANTGYNCYVYGKEHLAALGYMLPHQAGIYVACKTVPATGYLSVLVKAWA